MKRFLTKFIATMLVLSLASQASALFVTPDTFDPRMQGVGTNRYAYAGNDPINNSDPNGHCFGLCTAAVIWAVTAVTAYSVTRASHAATEAAIDVATGEKTPQQAIEDSGPAIIAGIGGAAGAHLIGKGVSAAAPYMDDILRRVLGRRAGISNSTGPRIVAQDGDAFEYSMVGRNGSEITVITNQSIEGNRLVLNGLHIDGAGAGTSSIRELRQFARDLGRQQGVDQVVIRGGIRTTGANPGHTPRDIIVRVNE